MENKNSNQEFISADAWDWQIRVLHWANAILIITLALLALSVDGMKWLGVEKPIRRPVKEIHAYIGYVFIFTLTLRIFWGFIGNQYARWSDIIPYTKEKWRDIVGNIKWYFSGFKTQPPVAIGHNHLASLFYIPLFLVLISQALTGLALAGMEFGLAPLSSYFSSYDHDAKKVIEDILEEAHEFGLWFIIFFFSAHMIGLIVHEMGEKTGLFSSMIHGKKYFPKEKI